MSAGREHEREVDDRIADWVDGRLSDRDRERFVAELRVSAQLRRDLEDYERTVASVREALQAPTMPVQLVDRVMSAIAEGRAQPTSGGTLHRWRPLLWSLASAAALLVVVLLIDRWSAPAAPAAPRANLTAKFEGAETRDAGSQNKQFVPGGGSEKPEQQPQSSLDELLDRGARTEKDVAWGAAGKPDADQEHLRQELDSNRLVGAVTRDGVADEPKVTTVVPRPSTPAPAEHSAGDERGPPAPARRAKGRPPADDKPEAAPVADPAAVPVLEKHAEEGLEEAGAPAAVPVPTSPPVPVDPLPLVVVLGRAPAVSELFAARARTDTKERVLGEKAKTQDAETKAVDDIGRRFEEFFTAQVADMTQVAAPAGGAGGAKKARSGQGSAAGSGRRVVAGCRRAASAPARRAGRVDGGRRSWRSVDLDRARLARRGHEAGRGGVVGPTGDVHGGCTAAVAYGRDDRCKGSEQAAAGRRGGTGLLPRPAGVRPPAHRAAFQAATALTSGLG
jgi:hypothetical protein